MSENETDSAGASDDKGLRAEKIETGFHPDGYRIDKTASLMNRYTKWEIVANGEWKNPKAVCFHSLPERGWQRAESFKWDE